MTPPERPEVEANDDLLEAAWGIIANASSGNWSKQSKEWQEAAKRWRAQYFDRGPVPLSGTLDNDREIAHLLSSTITEAALAGVSLGAYERRDLARLVRAAAAEPLRGALDHIRGLASGDGGDQASRLDPHNALATIVIVCDAALERGLWRRWGGRFDVEAIRDKGIAFGFQEAADVAREMGSDEIADALRGEGIRRYAALPALTSEPRAAAPLERAE